MAASPPELPSRADVVIVGAGIAGMSTAWFLHAAGIDVAVCEKGKVAGEQSSRNWGWIRQQGRDQAELPIVMESMHRWQEIADTVDTDIGYARLGALYLCENDAEMARHDRFMSFAPAYGLKTRRLSRREIEDLIVDCPPRWQSALFTPDDGRAEPSLAVPAMARKLAGDGVAVREQCAVLEITTRDRAVDGVVTEHGRIDAPAVLVAAGAWSSRLLRDCGIDLPQLTVKASVARTAPMTSIFDGNASGSQIAFRRRLDGGYSVAMTDYLEVFPSFDHLRHIAAFLPLLKTSYAKLRPRWPEVRIDGNYTATRTLDPKPSTTSVARLRQRLVDRMPAFENVEFVEAWAGMIDALPDVVPVLDRASVPDGLWIATGFSGHGFGIGPAAGRIMADLIQGNPVEFDLSRFRLARFADGSPLELGPAI